MSTTEIEYIDLEKFKQKVFDYSIHKEWVFDKTQPLIVNFTASWCGPCRMFAPVLEEVATAYAGKLTVYKIDIDATPELPALFGIRSVPTTLFLAPHQDPAIASGVMPIESMKEAIRDLLGI